MNVREAAQDPISASMTPEGLLVYRRDLGSGGYVRSDVWVEVKP